MALVLFSAAEQQCSGTNTPQVALRMEIWRDDTGSGVDAVGNRESLWGRLMLVRRGSSGGSYNLYNNCSAAASANGSSLASVSGIGYDFRASSGMGAVGSTKTLWEGWFTVVHDADGTKTLPYAGSWTSPSGDLIGSTSVSNSVVLPKISQTPSTPTGFTATWVSDTQASLAWTNNYPSNGAPTTSNVQSSVNGAAFATVATLAATQSAAIATEANRKTVYRVNAQNATGASAWSATATVFTTPAAPTSVSAAKGPAGDILVAWASHVAFTEHEHVIEHSADGGSSWSALAVVAGGTSSYTHASPSASVPHTYRVRARNTDTGSRASAWVGSNTVVLLTAPSKPTIPTLNAYQDRGAAFLFAWVHNAIDTTAQIAFESAYSTDGGSTWTSTGKTTSTDAFRSYPASSWAANQQVAFRVRTWGQATVGGSDGAGASPWSDPVTATFKSRPVATIVGPANGGIYDSAALTVQLAFAQSEGASFVSATIELHAGATLLEQRVSTTLAATLMTTRVANDASYTLRVTVRDSNGLLSSITTSTFTVTYTEPVAAAVTVDYLEESGVGQLGIAIPDPVAGEVAAVAVTVTRTIAGATETIVERYPASAALTILDTTPTIRGTNVYVVTTISADGATTEVEQTLTTAEPWRAFLSTGVGYARIVSFGGDLTFTSKPTRSTALVQAAGRRRPIAMFGEQTGLEVSGSTTIVPGLGSSAQEIEEFLLEAGSVCYRDASGRRMFGIVTGSLDTPNSLSSAFQFTVTEATS